MGLWFNLWTEEKCSKTVPDPNGVFQQINPTGHQF